jgi:alpha-N-arabinofuranosidase
MDARLRVNATHNLGVVNPNIYGNFAEHLGRCIYGGLWVGPRSTTPNDDGLRLDTTSALRDLRLPVLRWPGGCFADNYHWQWGVGPQDQRRPRHNLWWDQPEPNEFGTDEFLRACAVIGCEPYVCLNVGSGSVEEALGWVEYCNSAQDTYYTRLRRDNGRRDPYRVRYFGVGNENYGCGGSMTAEQYAFEYRKFATYLRQMDSTIDGGLFLVAAGLFGDYNAEFFRHMNGALHLLDGFSIHLYVGGFSRSATEFSDDDHYRLMGEVLGMEEAVVRASHLLRYYSTFGRRLSLIVDEWGTWYPEANTPSGLYQQSALRDALYTVCALNMFNRHCERVAMTNMAQTINVLQSLLLTQGSQMVRTPTYWAYWMFRDHIGATAVAADVDAPSIKDCVGRDVPCVSASASTSPDGARLVLTLANIHLTESVSLEVSLTGASASAAATGLLLSAPDIRAHNTFDAPDTVSPAETSVPARGDAFTIAIPAASAISLTVPLS